MNHFTATIIVERWLTTKVVSLFVQNQDEYFYESERIPIDAHMVKALSALIALWQRSFNLSLEHLGLQCAEFFDKDGIKMTKIGGGCICQNHT